MASRLKCTDKCSLRECSNMKGDSLVELEERDESDEDDSDENDDE